MTEEPEERSEDTEAEQESAADSGRVSEPQAASAEETTRPASEADPSASPQGDELADAVEDVTEEEPTPRRRRRRRGATAAQSTEAEPGPTAETEPSAEESDGEPESEADQEPDAEAGEEPEAEADEEPEAEADEEPEAEAEAEPEEPGAPARPPRSTRSRRRARERDPDLPAPVVRAQAKYVRSSARKARLVCDHIRGKSVDEARAILALTPRAIARDWSKLLESAVANAEHNHELVGEDLYVKAVHADEGPTIKRFRPRAMGRATRIRKRTSHLTILLEPKD
jgi:large subunit ribosomal protein L22